MSQSTTFSPSRRHLIAGLFSSAAMLSSHNALAMISTQDGQELDLATIPETPKINSPATPQALAREIAKAPRTENGLASTRGLWLVNPHTGEESSEIFWREGKYDTDSYSRICHLMRDWRENVVVAMDPKLLHLLYAIQTRANFAKPIMVTSAFRTLRTNEMLRPEGAALNSQHLHSRACDVVIPGYEPEDIAKAALNYSAGGIGIYSRFTHIDSRGEVAIWRG